MIQSTLKLFSSIHFHKVYELMLISLDLQDLYTSIIEGDQENYICTEQNITSNT